MNYIKMLFTSESSRWLVLPATVMAMTGIPLWWFIGDALLLGGSMWFLGLACGIGMTRAEWNVRRIDRILKWRDRRAG